jgi:hypothetical protein
MNICNNFTKSFLIIDLGASLIHTHHKQSIYAFSDLLQNNLVSFEAWVPFGSEIDSCDFPIKKNLMPGTHGASFKFFDLRSWINAAFTKLLTYIIYFKIDFLIKFFVFISAKYLCFLITHNTDDKKRRIIFTTACPFAIKTVYLLEKNHIEASIFFRLTNTSETRGRLSEIYDFRKLISESKKFESVTMRFGIETENYLKELTVDSDPRFFISPIPYMKQSFSDIDSYSNITISFLGHPTRNKGREHIIPIIEGVSKYKPGFKWQVHLYDEDPLENDLRKLNLEMVIVKGKIDSEAMKSLLKKTSVLCLPYNVEAFKMHASAMLYQAMDYLKPVLSFDGTSFSQDILEFNSGAVAKTSIELCDLLINVDTEQVNSWVEGCIAYNVYRTSSNIKFLGL